MWPLRARAAATIAAGDLDGDGKIDLAVPSGKDQLVAVFLGKGDGTFAPRKDLPQPQPPARVALGDLDGDGKLDMVLTNLLNGTISVLLNRSK